MQLKLWTLLALVVPFTLQASDIDADKIIGGRKSAGHNFFLQLSMDGSLSRSFCGATAIAPGVAVTAAHCVAARTMSFKLVHGIDQDGIKNLSVIDVDAVVPHHLYNGTANDIALIFFNKDQGRNIIPAKINRGEIAVTNNSTFTAIGRGNLTSMGNIYQSDLFEVDVPGIDLPTCQSVEAYEGAINHTHVCAGVIELGGKDSCQGDSGGPLVAVKNGQTYLVGVVNFGLGCGQKGLPGVYASPRAHANWIDSNISRYQTNETAFTPNIELAFKSKCHITKTHDELFTASDATTMGQLSLSSLYESTSRFLNTSAPVLTANAKEVCRFKLGQTLYIAQFDKQKILVQNTASKRWWQAVGKRSTDSLYQRCQVAKTAFDIAVGDGAAMIAIGDQTALLQQIQAAQVPADTTEQINCKIDRFETKISRSESANATLVELKNHIDEKSSHFVIVGGGNSPRTASKKLDLKLEVDWSNQAKFTIENVGDEDLFSWELTCNKDFSVFNEYRVSSKTIRHLAAQSSKGSVLQGDRLELTVIFDKANPNANKDLKCTLNRDFAVAIQ